MTSHCITWHDTTQAITSHQMTWPSHDLTPQQTSRHQNTSLQSTKHHHHGTAEGSFTAKKGFGHRAGRSPCAHSIGKFFLCYIVLFLLETSAPGLSGYYWYLPYQLVSRISSSNRNRMDSECRNVYHHVYNPAILLTCCHKTGKRCRSHNCLGRVDLGTSPNMCCCSVIVRSL